jgi:hypothetical protein
MAQIWRWKDAPPPHLGGTGRCLLRRIPQIWRYPIAGPPDLENPVNRYALKGTLEDSFDVEVVNVTEYDDEGEVFGRPDQVELDLIIKDGLLIVCEIKSSVSKADMYTFERKVRFYERKHERQASRALVISPMVDKQARIVANKLGIEVYSYVEDIDPALFA